MRAGNIELSLCAAAGAAAAGLAWSKYERGHFVTEELVCLLYTSPSPRDA